MGIVPSGVEYRLHQPNRVLVEAGNPLIDGDSANVLDKGNDGQLVVYQKLKLGHVLSLHLFVRGGLNLEEKFVRFVGIPHSATAIILDKPAAIRGNVRGSEAFVCEIKLAFDIAFDPACTFQQERLRLDPNVGQVLLDRGKPVMVGGVVVVVFQCEFLVGIPDAVCLGLRQQLHGFVGVVLVWVQPLQAPNPIAA